MLPESLHGKTELTETAQVQLCLLPAACTDEQRVNLLSAVIKKGDLRGRSELCTKQPGKALVCSQDSSQDFSRIRGQVRKRSLFEAESNKNVKKKMSNE